MKYLTHVSRIGVTKFGCTWSRLCCNSLTLCNLRLLNSRLACQPCLLVESLHLCFFGNLGISHPLLEWGHDLWLTWSSLDLRHDHRALASAVSRHLDWYSRMLFLSFTTSYLCLSWHEDTDVQGKSFLLQLEFIKCILVLSRSTSTSLHCSRLNNRDVYMWRVFHHLDFINRLLALSWSTSPSLLSSRLDLRGW